MTHVHARQVQDSDGFRDLVLALRLACSHSAIEQKVDVTGIHGPLARPCPHRREACTGGLNVAASWPMRSLAGTLHVEDHAPEAHRVSMSQSSSGPTGLPLARHPPPVCYERSLFSTASCGCRGPLPTCRPDYSQRAGAQSLCSGPLRISRLPTPLSVPPPFSKWLETRRVYCGAQQDPRLDAVGMHRQASLPLDALKNG